MFGLRTRYLSFFFGLISILSFFNVIYSYYLNLYLNLNTYYISLISSLFIAIIFFKFEKNKNKTSIFEKILTVFFGYLLIPLILALPLYFSIYNLTFLNAYFESISGFTSTGFTIFENIKHLDESLILWRSTSQWIGGIYFLFSILLLIDIFDDNLKKSLTNFISFSYSETFKMSLKIFILYIFLSLFLFLCLKLIDLRTFDSFNLSMTIISSGGFLPFNDINSVINSNTKEIIFSILMLFSYFSLFLTYNIFFLKKKNLNFFAEDIYLFIYFIILLIIFFVFFNSEYNFSSILFSLTSSMSNIGISFNNSASNLWFLFLIIVIIGGSFFSTSSGLRFIKIYSLFKYSINQILSFSRPKNIYMNKLLFTKINFDFKEINKYFLTIIIFILSLFILTSLLSLSGITFVNSFKLSILTLMNTVNSSIYGLEEFDFYNLQLFSKYCLIFFMIVGRIELLTILLLIKKFLFKN